jgi:hypothetical protein
MVLTCQSLRGYSQRYGDLEPNQQFGGGARPRPDINDKFRTPERLLERSVKMNPGEIVLARMWSTGRWRNEGNWDPTFSTLKHPSLHLWRRSALWAARYQESLRTP